MATPTARLETAWHWLSPLPGGRWLFARFLGLVVPYSGSIRPRVRALEPGRAEVALRERWRLRNHLGSVHAIALANLGELSSGLAMALALPSDVRGIPVRLEIDYRKKARGTITAVGRAEPPPTAGPGLEAPATAVLTDASDEVVAEVVVTWRLGPRKGSRVWHRDPGT